MRVVAVLFAVALLATGVSAAAPGRTNAPSLVVTLTADGKTARAGQPWHFVVRAVDAQGHAVRASARVRAIAYGESIDTVGWFGFNGVLRRTYRWSPTLGGATAQLEAKVVGPRATRVVRYSVHVVSDTGRPRFRATLVGSSHAATAGAPWHFLVRALDAHGNSIQGTAIVRVVAGGRIVDTVGWFGFKRRILHAYRWSPTLRGSVALLQAKVVGPGGTRTVVYAVRVR
jgi:nitroreductase